MKIANPVIPGFAPDPSVVLVGGTFFLVNSSFHVFPALPIYASTDLREWRLVSHAITNPSCLDLSRSFVKHIPIPGDKSIVITGGLFAPTIRFHRGNFFIVCTNAYETEAGEHCFQNFLISCPEDKIFSGDGWSEPIPFDFPGIDPGLFFDPNTGKAYLHGSYRTGPPWAPDCSIRQFEIDVATGKALSETRFLWKGAAGKDDAEGPHIFHKDGWYYLVTAEASTFEGHQINIARSKDIWGPYESCPANPLLTALGTNEPIQWTGHGDLFHDSLGRWFCVHLGVRYQDELPGRYPLGRETFLTTVDWSDDQWPTISQTKLNMEIDTSENIAGGEVEGLIAPAIEKTAQEEEVYIRTPCYADYKRSSHAETHYLRAKSTSLSAPFGTTTFVGRRQRSLSSIATCEVRLSDLKEPIIGRAGLTVFKDCLRHASISVDMASRTVILEVCSLQEPKRMVLATSDPAANEANTVHLQIESVPGKYSFLWRDGTRGNNNWQLLGEIDSMKVSAHDMTGTLFGIFATGAGESEAEERPWVQFDGFKII